MWFWIGTIIGKGIEAIPPPVTKKANEYMPYFFERGWLPFLVVTVTVFILHFSAA